MADTTQASPTIETPPDRINGISQNQNVPNADGSAFVARATPAPRVNPDTIGTADSGSYKAANGLYYDSSGAPVTGSPQEALDRVNATAAKYQNLAQQTTDIINSKYNNKASADKALIADMDSRVRVLNSRNGTTGSATGDTAVINNQEKGNKVLAADEAGRASELQAGLGKIDELAGNEQKANEAASRNDLVTAQNIREKNKADAEVPLKALAGHGIDLETLKQSEPQSYAALLKSTGLSPLELSAYYNNLKSTANQTKWQYKVTGNTVTAYGVDAKGNLKTQEQTVPGLSAGNYTVIKGDNGTLYKENKNTGEISKLVDTAKPGSDYTTVKGANGVIYKQDKATGKLTPLVNAAKPVNPRTASGTNATTQQKNEENDALNWLARQPGYDPKNDPTTFKNNPVLRAKAIAAANAEKASTKKTPTNPFSTSK